MLVLLSWNDKWIHLYHHFILWICADTTLLYNGWKVVLMDAGGFEGVGYALYADWCDDSLWLMGWMDVEWFGGYCRNLWEKWGKNEKKWCLTRQVLRERQMIVAVWVGCRHIGCKKCEKSLRGRWKGPIFAVSKKTNPERGKQKRV